MSTRVPNDVDNTATVERTTNDSMCVPWRPNPGQWKQRGNPLRARHTEFLFPAITTKTVRHCWPTSEMFAKNCKRIDFFINAKRLAQDKNVALTFGVDSSRWRPQVALKPQRRSSAAPLPDHHYERHIRHGAAIDHFFSNRTSKTTK